MTRECSSKLLQGHNESFSISEQQKKYVREIAELCRENQAELVMMKTPNVVWSIEQSEMSRALAEEVGVDYIEFNALNVIDNETDFCDGGTHCNNQGAEKLSDYLGIYMKEHYAMGGREEKSSDVQEYFDQRVQYLDQLEQSVNLAQEQDFDAYWEKINDDDYVILISAVRNKRTKDILKNKVNIYNDDGKKVCISFMIEQGKVVNQSYSKYGKSPSCFTLKEHGHIFYVETGADELGDINSKIQLDYQNYSVGEEINIVIYDRVLDCVVDSCGISLNEDKIVEINHYKGM